MFRIAAGCTAPAAAPAVQDRAPGAAAIPGVVIDVTPDAVRTTEPSPAASPTPTQAPTKAPEPTKKPTPVASKKPAPAPSKKPAPAPKPQPKATLSAEAMLTAPVPSLCGQPAGTLVDGRLPGIAPARVQIAQLDGARRTESFHTFTAEGKTYGALVIQCDNGGVPWAQRVVVYDANVKVVGAIAFDALLGDGRQVVVGATVTEGGVRYAVDGTRADGDPACCGSIQAFVTVDVQDGKVVTSPDTILPRNVYAQDVFNAILNNMDSITDAEFITDEGRQIARDFEFAGGTPDFATCAQVDGSPAEEWVCEFAGSNGINAWLTIFDHGWGNYESVIITQGPAGA